MAAQLSGERGQVLTRSGRRRGLLNVHLLKFAGQIGAAHQVEHSQGTGELVRGGLGSFAVGIGEVFCGDCSRPRLQGR